MAPTTTDERAEHSHDHNVAFYRDDDELAASVAAFLAESLTAGGSAVVIATPEHRALFDATLERLGHTTEDVQASGRYVVLDAAQTLAAFTVDGALDANQFDAVIGQVLDAACAHGTPVRAYGEMVALLWDAGNVGAALELESMWNNLATRRQFTLMCAYAESALDSSSLQNATEVCRLHSQVDVLNDRADDAAPRNADQLVTVSGAFVPLPESVRAARRFVIEALTGHVAVDLVDDAALSITELAANAIKHEASAFRITVARGASRLRISVEDCGIGVPQLRAYDPLLRDGRGLAMASALADEWGYDRTATGKSVWVEFAVPVV